MVPLQASGKIGDGKSVSLLRNLRLDRRDEYSVVKGLSGGVSEGTTDCGIIGD